MSIDGRESAKIYPFPKRVSLAATGFGKAANSDADQVSRATIDAASGGGWYHDAAIEEAGLGVKTGQLVKH